MSLDHYDRDDIQGLEPPVIEVYLIHNLWKRIDYEPDHHSDWRYIPPPYHPVVTVPLKKSFADYIIRVAELIATLSKVEKRSEHIILSDLVSIQKGKL